MFGALNNWLRSLSCSLAILLLFSCFSFSKDKPAPPPSDFIVGQLTFFDFGPPFSFYDIFIVHGDGDKTLIKKIALTPKGISCMQPPKLELVSGEINEPIANLWAGKNPCSISEKDVEKESKRKKKGLVFSGADVNLQVQCGTRQRVIMINVLDRDIFDTRAKTPEHTSWTMQLMSKLGAATGPGPMDRPVFGTGEEHVTPVDLDEKVIRDLKAGVFDALFGKDREPPSVLYGATQTSLPISTVHLVSSTPFMPTKFSLPAYPPLARAARFDGVVTASALISENGAVTAVEILSGGKLLQPTVIEAVNKWEFPMSASGKSTTITLEFHTTCPTSN